jgi:hypothetical protein
MSPISLQFFIFHMISFEWLKLKEMKFVRQVALMEVTRNAYSICFLNFMGRNHVGGPKRNWGDSTDIGD